MSTPDNAWRILTSDTETDVSSYYVTIPTNIDAPTNQTDVVYDAKEIKFDRYESWKNYCLEGTGTTDDTCKYDADIASKYPTLFEYWESEVYIVPQILTGLDADYIIVNLVAAKLPDDNVMDLYTLEQKGGDETKAFWFMKISDLQVLDYYNRDLQSYKNKFWDNTLLGNLIPFTPIAYVDPNNTEIQSKTFKPGYLAIYVKDIKFPTSGDGPFQLVYVPPSFEKDAAGPLTGPLIYKINKDYNPNQ